MSITVPTSSYEDTFYVVDFDRTLADSDKLLDVFISIANYYTDISYEQIKKIDADIKIKGDSFDTARHVRDQLIDRGMLAQWHQLEKQYIHESRSLNMLLPGAAQLLEFFTTTSRRYGILTYGNPLWQHLKLSASGFNHVPRIVTTQKKKGNYIASWQRDDKIFSLPDEFGGGEAAKIVLIDDKAVSFDGIPGRPSRGYHVVNYDTALPAQRGEVPGNVTRVTSLYEVIERL